jgi:hypothetical protein
VFSETPAAPHAPVHTLVVPTLLRGNAVLVALRPIFRYQHAYKRGLLPAGRSGGYDRLRSGPAMPDAPHTPVLLPVPGRSRASSLPRPAARISTIVRRSASYAVLDAQRPGPPHAPVLLPVPGRSRASSLPRPAARISTIVRRSASYAVLDAQRPTACTGPAAGSRQIASKLAPTACGQNLNYRAALRFVCRSGRSAARPTAFTGLTAGSRQIASKLAPTACGQNLNHRAALCVACRSGRSASYHQYL